MMINVNRGKLKPDKQTWTEKHLLKTSLESVLLLKIPATNTNAVTWILTQLRDHIFKLKGFKGGH